MLLVPPDVGRRCLLHGDSFSTVRDYYDAFGDRLDIIDLRDFVPAFLAKDGHDAGS